MADPIARSVTKEVSESQQLGCGRNPKICGGIKEQRAGRNK